MTKLSDTAIELRAVLDELDDVNAKKSELGARKDELLFTLQTGMEETGSDSLKFEAAGISVTKKEVLKAAYDPEHWEGIFKWANDSGRSDCIHRRLSDAKIVEYMESGGALPEGLRLEPLTKMGTRRSEPK